MAGFDGSGNFTLNYSFVAQAAAGVKILASQMDTQFNTLATALNSNLLCRDGQNKPSANIDWNSKKITNLANGTATGDAVNYGQLSAVTLSDWVAEVNGLQYVSIGSFKVLGADVTGTYLPGRALKLTITAGTWLGYVVSSSYSAPDTTVSCISLVSGTSVDSGISAAWYGLQSPAQDGSPQHSAITGWSLFSDQAVSAASNTNLNLDALGQDSLGEVTAGSPGIWRPRYRGHYLFTARLAATTAFTGSSWFSPAGTDYIPFGPSTYTSIFFGGYHIMMAQSEVIFVNTITNYNMTVWLENAKTLKPIYTRVTIARV